jgi:hypothetical protein
MICRIMVDIAKHQAAMPGSVDEGARLGELARRAAELFDAQPAAEKRKLLDYVVSECRWKGGELELIYRQPFGMMVSAGAMQQAARKPVQRDVVSNAQRASGGLRTNTA